MKKGRLIAFAAFMTLLTFQRAFFANYVLWDDDALIFNNIILKMPFWEALRTSFTKYYHGDYFPLTLMSYWVDIQVFGAEAVGQHAVNLVLQIFNVALMALFLYRLTENYKFAAVATLLFAIHPLQTETVMWISERKSLISGVFTLASLYFFLLSQKGKGWAWYSVSMMCFLAACLAKATAVLLPVLFVVLDLKQFGRDWKKIGIRFAPVAIAAGILSYMRYTAYSVSVAMVNDSIWNSERILHIPLMALNAIGFYLIKFFWPTGLSSIYPNYFPKTSVYFSSFVVAVLLLAVGYRLWKTRDFYLAFFALWFLLFLAPVLQIIPRINYVNDRYMYLPIVGLVGMLFYALPWEKWSSRLPLKYSRAGGILAIATLSLISFNQSKIWETNRTLWENAIQIFPDSAIAHNNLALDYQKYEEWDRAISHYNVIIKNASEESNKLLAFNNLANIYANPRFPGFNTDTAISLLQEGIRRVHQLRESYELRTNLGLLYYKQQRFTESKQVFRAILADLDREPDFRFNWLRDLAQKIVSSPSP